MRPAVAVCGPTATGKSALAFWLARRFGGEVIGADSMQVYEGLVVGTAAVTPRQAGGVPQHLVGFLPPGQAFSVADWRKAADEVMEGICRRGALPVVCGGTGLYLQSLAEGLQYPTQKPGAARRAALREERERLGATALWERLRKVDEEGAARLHPHDTNRVLRALELWEETRMTAAERRVHSRRAPPQYDVLCLGLTYENREALYARINRRVDEMMANGLLQEAKCVWDNRFCYRTAAQAIGYKEFFPYFETGEGLEFSVEEVKKASRRYAKRQLTWFGRMPGVHWLLADDPLLRRKAQALAERHLQQFA